MHSFEAVDREIMTRCRLEGTKGGATGLVVLRMGEQAGWVGSRVGGLLAVAVSGRLELELSPA